MVRYKDQDSSNHSIPTQMFYRVTFQYYSIVKYQTHFHDIKATCLVALLKDVFSEGISDKKS